MLKTKVYTKDDNNRTTYYTEDKLYAAYGSYDDDYYITVGSNSSSSLNAEIKVALTSENATTGSPYDVADTSTFWLRTPNYMDPEFGFLVLTGDRVTGGEVQKGYSVVPAFSLDLSSVIFASAAQAAISSTATGANTAWDDAFTFRFNGSDKIKSTASYNSSAVNVSYDTSDTSLYLYVQGKNDGTDWIYLKKIDSDNTTLAATEIASAKGLSSVDLSNCKIWLETTDTSENLTYAREATYPLNINSVAITDITAPVANSVLDISAACSTTGVSTTAPTVTWAPSATKAGYSTEYTASVTLAASAGCGFADSATATVNGQAATSVKVNDDGTLTVTYTFPATAAAPAEDPKTPAYKITAGAGETHKLNSDGSLQITCSGALDKLIEIYVDDSILATTNYTLASGSTILTLKAEYLNTLSVGTHKLKFVYSDGSAETTFVINETSDQGKTTELQQTTVTKSDTANKTTSTTDVTPDTGDTTPIALIFVVSLLTGLLGAYFFTEELKQRKN
jgi:hypothetical protein